MTDSHSDPQQEGRGEFRSRDNGRASYRGGRGPGNRDQGGFRIRLSDNEMRSARALQDAFNLRSTVAVLGFALRTLGQMLEEGKLDELIKEHRSQSPRKEGRPKDSRGAAHFEGERTTSQKGARPNPFARPPKPEPSVQDSEKSTTDQKEVAIPSESLADENESKENSGEVDTSVENGEANPKKSEGG